MYKVIRHASELPEEWDNLCKYNVYMSRAFLEYMESANPCHQSYHLFYRENSLYSCFMMFHRRFNLFIFTNRWNIKLRMKFIYLPLSVSEPSIIFPEDTSELETVLNRMKGLKIIINTDQEQKIANFTQGEYLPICVLKNRWNSFEDYMADLRSGYRRRYMKAMEKAGPISFEMLEDNKQFTEEMYALYEEVFEHSIYALEKLNLQFFQNPFSKIVCLNIKGKPQAFVQIIEDQENHTLIFEFGGYNYALAHEYDLYHNMLIWITKYAIEHKFEYIQYGQTAYDAKLKFGADMYHNYFLLSHHNRLLNRWIRKKIHFLEYKVQKYEFHVFKKEGD